MTPRRESVPEGMRDPFEPEEPDLEEGDVEPGEPVVTGARNIPAVARHEDLVARVRELIGKYPNIGSRPLFDLAVRMHPDVEQAGFRSFHARYVLPLKREKARAEGRMPKRRKEAAKGARKTRDARSEARPSGPPASGAESARLRARVRSVLLRLAREVAVAESRADLVDVLARVEDMVDEIVGALHERATRTGGE
jgi:hypothetical protein